jgi:hypothetical protein
MSDHDESESPDEIDVSYEQDAQQQSLDSQSDWYEFRVEGHLAPSRSDWLDGLTSVNLVGGRLRLLGTARSFKGGLKRVLNLVERMRPLDDLAVVHTRSPEVAEQMADRLAGRTRFPRAHIWVRETGTVLATHAGPGVIGVLAVPTPSTELSFS